MKNPWLKFYPADWRSEPSLRVCSIAARGLWIEMLCLMHDATPRGSLMVGGRTVGLEQLASITGTPLKLVRSLFAELEANGVFSRDADGTIYSRRMRRDIRKEEQDRENGKRGGNPKLKGRVGRGVNPKDKAQKLEAEAEAEADSATVDSAVGRFKDIYPLDVQTDGVRRTIASLLDEGVSIDDIVAGAQRYAAEKAGIDRRFIMSPVQWLEDGRWKDGQHKRKTQEPSDRSLVARDDPRWMALEKRYRAEKNKPRGSTPLDQCNSWHFPNAWIEDLQERVS